MSCLAKVVAIAALWPIGPGPCPTFKKKMEANDARNLQHKSRRVELVRDLVVC